MLIRLSTEQECRLLQWAGLFTEAEMSSDIEPSGYEIRVSIAPGLGCFAEAIKGAYVLELGEVEVVLQQEPAAQEINAGKKEQGKEK